MHPISKDISKVILPIIRNVMPSVIANSILGVQPMASSVRLFRTQLIYQLNDYSYEFYSECNPEILDWLTHGCSWDYQIYNTIDTQKTLLTFSDINGSIEFKLRFEVRRRKTDGETISLSD